MNFQIVGCSESIYKTNNISYNCISFFRVNNVFIDADTHHPDIRVEVVQPGFVKWKI